MAQLKSMSLIVTALLFLAIPGLLYNNLNANGLNVSQAQGLTCSTDPQTPTCQISGNVGCQASATYCQLSGSSISFLNPSSPFTQMLSGNLFALFTNLNPLAGNGASQTSWSGSHGPFDITGNPNFYSADCQGAIAAGHGGTQSFWALGRCTQTNTDNSNVTEANAATWNNWNTNWNTTKALQFYQVGNGTFARTCAFLAQINYTAVSNSAGWTYFGCSINQAPVIQSIGTNPTHRAWAMLIAMPVSYGVLPGGSSHQHLFVQLTNWYTAQCLNNIAMGPYLSGQCNNFLAGFKGVSIPGSSTTFVPNSAGAIVFGFLAGVILLLLGLGLTLGVGGGVSAGTNDQGARLAQALGIGLIVWTSFYSQFSTWFTTGLLPYGFDGSVGIVAITLSGMFFFGVLWRALSLD